MPETDVQSTAISVQPACDNANTVKESATAVPAAFPSCQRTRRMTWPADGDPNPHPVKKTSSTRTTSPPMTTNNKGTGAGHVRCMAGSLVLGTPGLPGFSWSHLSVLFCRPAGDQLRLYADQDEYGTFTLKNANDCVLELAC